jgi:N-hydroxyarylamine O-acetyltransferase
LTTASQVVPDLDAYFQRIGIARPLTSLDGLRRIIHAHTFAIPFENLDPYLGRMPSLLLQDVEQKLVRSGRGGYCFEQNLLLGEVLKALGFKVERRMATVLWMRGTVPDLRPTHHFLVVRCEARHWLVDAGFGGVVLTSVLDLDERQPQLTSHGVFQLHRSHDGGQLSFQTATGWEPMYRFDGVSRGAEVFHPINQWIATDPQSRFVCNLIAARATSQGRISLLNREFTERRLDGTTHRRVLDTTDELMEVLGLAFGIATDTLPGLRKKLQSL